MRMDAPVGQVNYEPSSLGPDVAHESAERGFKTFPNLEEGEQLRVRPETFADHLTQARMFFASQTEPEQNHIVAALVFELSKCLVPRVREAMLGRLINIDETMAARVATGLGFRGPIEPAIAAAPAQNMALSPALSILRKAVATLEGRKIGCMVADGADAALIAEFRAAAENAGAVFQLIGPAITGIITEGGELLPVDHKVEGGPSVLFDAVVLLPSVEGGAKLALMSEAVNFVRDAFGHLKVIAYLPSAAPLFVKGGLSDANPDKDRGMVALARSSASEFIAEAAKGRVWEREPAVRLMV